MDMTAKALPPGRSRVRSLLGLLLAVAALGFGIWLLNVVGDIPEAGGGAKALAIAFGIVWFVFWIGAIVVNVLRLRARPKKPGSSEA